MVSRGGRPTCARRLADRFGELAATAAPAAAALVAAAVAIVPSDDAGSKVQTADRAPTAVATAPVERDAAAPPVIAPLDPGSASAVPAPVEGADVSEPVKPRVRFGPTDVYTGDDADRKRAEVEQMPTYMDLGPAAVGADPKEMVERVIDRVIDAGPEEPDTP